MTEPTPYDWPAHTAATLLAGLAATRDNDQRARDTRLLKEDG